MQREDLWAWIVEQYGNLASVIGLGLTLYVMWSLRRIRQATEAAIQYAVGRVRSQWVLYEVIGLHQRLRELVSFIGQRNWSRSLDRCYEARNHLSFLLDQPELSGPERLRLATVGSDLATVANKLEKISRSTAKKRLPDLTSTQKVQLDNIIQFAGRLEARLKHQALEAIHGRE